MYKNLKAWSQAFFMAIAGPLLLSSPVATAEAPPLQVGLVYVTPLVPSGWVAQHDAGRRAIESASTPRRPSAAWSHAMWKTWLKERTPSA